jgi:hypothetical protein
MSRKHTQKKTSKKRSRSTESEPKPAGPAAPEPSSAQEKAEKAAENYFRGVVTRGEAAETDGGKLPLGATHEIVEKDEEGRPTKIVRRRFSMS